MVKEVNHLRGEVNIQYQILSVDMGSIKGLVNKILKTESSVTSETYVKDGQGEKKESGIKNG